MSFKQALEYVRNKRSVVCPNYGFQNELKRYQLTLKQGIEQKKQYSYSNYSDFSEKKIVMDFIEQEKKTAKRGQKLNLTTSGTKNNSSYMTGSLGLGTFNDPSGFLRGKSVHYGTKKRQTDFTPDFKAAQRSTKQYLNHKFDGPKMITYKK